jgi:outer membrane receptor protein involved in Fe transport
MTGFELHLSDTGVTTPVSADTGTPETAAPRRRFGFVLFVLIACLSVALGCSQAAVAQERAAETERARIEGRIRDRRTEEPLESANISIVGTSFGTISLADGSYLIEDIAPGELIISVSYIGYEKKREVVQLEAGETTVLNFELNQTIAATIATIEIRAERKAIDVTSTSTSHTLTSTDLQEMATQAPTLDDVVAQQPGVVKDGDKLHFRGGRANENLFVIDGVTVKDLLSGESSGNEIAARSAQRVEIVTGGFGAKFSQAMSGVVDTKLKEGTRLWHGAVAYDSDMLTDTQELHHVYAEISGPNTLATRLLRLMGNDKPQVTFFTSFSTELSDGYLPGIRDLRGDHRLRSSMEDAFLGKKYTYGTFFSPRASNHWRGIFKSAWKMNKNNKLAFSFTKSISIIQDWGAADIGDINRNTSSFPWSWSRRQDHHYTRSKNTSITSLLWNCSIGRRASTSVQVWRNFMGRHDDVAGKNWLDYNYRDNDSDLFWNIDTPYFVDTGDANSYKDQHSIVWGIKNNWTAQLGAHEFSLGLSTEYQDVQYFKMNTSSIVTGSANPNDDRPLGSEFDLFHVTPSMGNINLSDSFSFEGMTTNLGLIYDYWFPGKQVEDALNAQTQAHMTEALRDKYYEETSDFFGNRYKAHISPRIGSSFPINERAHLFFSYGHYSQVPPLYYVYAKTNAQSGEEFPQLGNPTLNPKISVQYEIGTGYEITEATSVKSTIFWKDMYDYPTTITVTMDDRSTTRSNFFMYWNMDYARSRGIEFNLMRRLQDAWSGSFSYTYSVAKGKSSDPSKNKLIQDSGGDSRETELGEEFLWWNRPHKLTARLGVKVKENEIAPRWMGVRLPQDINFSLYCMVRSGRPYTPVNEEGERTGDNYSKNGPIDQSCDLVLRKGFRISGKRLELALKIYNLFDHRNVSNFDHITGQPYEYGVGSLRFVDTNPENLKLSDEELVAAYAAERDIEPDRVSADGIRKSIINTMYRYSNPSYKGRPRAIRIGLNYEW